MNLSSLLSRSFVLIALFALCLGVSSCGRKPSTLDAPDNAATYTYPPLDQKP